LDSYGEDHAIHVVYLAAALEHLLGEVPSRMVSTWGGGPFHCCHRIQEILASAALQRLHLKHLPVSAPELNPDEGSWQQLKGIEQRHVGGFRPGSFTLRRT
jgi:DDE superfamily endonuclease